MGELLGYEMRMTLNTGYPVAGKYDQDWHYAVISAVGPLITLLQAIIFFFLIKKYSNRNLYPFLFTPFYLELLSGIVGYRNPNDLGRIGNYLNIGLFTLPIFFIIIHYIMLHKTSKRENYDRKFIVTTLLLIILFSSVWILTNQKFKVILL
jgi:FtsH-binding integral membrane protein